MLWSKAMIDPDKGALELRIDGFHRIDACPETGAEILSSTVIDRMMCSKCFADFAINPIAIRHQNRLRFDPFFHDWPKCCALGVRNQGRLGLGIAVSGNQHDKLFGAAPPLVLTPFLNLWALPRRIHRPRLPLVIVGMNAVYSLGAWPVGVVSDRTGPFKLLIVGLVLLVAADLVLAFAGGLASIALGVLLWSLDMGFTQGLLAAMIAESVPPELRGTAFGMFNFVTGIALLFASVIAGALWDVLGAQSTFLAGAMFAALAVLALLPLGRHVRRSAQAKH